MIEKELLKCANKLGYMEELCKIIQIWEISKELCLTLMQFQKNKL